MLANAVRRASSAVVDVVDFDQERALGPIDLDRLLSPAYDLVGISCYSSFDYLKVMAIGSELRRRLPRAWLVTGGYHPSARPDDFTLPSSPFDYVVVGDGERPLARLAQALESGRRPLQRVLGPDSVPSPGELMPYDWTLLERYRRTARRVSSQAEIYLSRGCPYDCAFCMERAKRDTSWRALEPGQAVEELQRLDSFLDLSPFTLFIADALFGMKRDWRRDFLSELVRRPVRARKIWLLIRVDLVEKEDLELMARAGVAPGFGLESGDPEQLRRIRKAGRLHDYLEKMLTVSEWAKVLDLPFGANIIVGHPGETEASLRTSAAYMRRLFLDSKRGTHGFFSVDPFRLYPGSPIDDERDAWERETGMRVHRYPWWHDGDQGFLSEWVDPSATLDFRTTLRLRHELFDPVVRAVNERFAYQGPARDYFLRAAREQIELVAPERRLATLGLHHLWRGLTGELDEPERRSALVADLELADVARRAREKLLSETRFIGCSPELRRALASVPRERFVAFEHVSDSARDCALPLSRDGRSTISALHAYAHAFQALGLTAGDQLVELGSGTGYGAALASELVGERGSVLTLELESELVARARVNLAGYAQTRVVQGDAHDVELWRGALKVWCSFALERLPQSFVEGLGDGGRLVAPLGTPDAQQLTLVEKRGTLVSRTELGPVRYVADRRPAAASSA